MDNSLSKYLGIDLSKSIESFQVVQGTSKTGSSYYALDIKFINGFSKRIFPNDAERFAIINAFDLSNVNINY